MNTPYRLMPTRTTLAFVALFAACGLALPLSATAQVAGSTPTSVTVLETSQLAMGWSAKKSILGRTVYHDSGEKVGRVEDLIVDPDRNVSYVIVGAGGFIGIGRHDVAVPISQIRQQNGRFLMAGATKDSVKAMAAFSYTD
ncbi:MAG: PRC-barrel domain-containing protein, partial [Rubrivivax sp.]